MARVKHNENVKNEQDLQNVVIGAIFRKTKPFTAESIVEIVKRNLKGSEFYNEIEMIEQHVDDTLNLLYLRNKVRCRNGTYYLRNYKTKRFPREYYEAKGMYYYCD